MRERSFKSFRDAASFARSAVRSQKVDVLVRRDDSSGGWIVSLPSIVERWTDYEWDPDASFAFDCGDEVADPWLPIWSELVDRDGGEVDLRLEENAPLSFPESGDRGGEG